MSNATPVSIAVPAAPSPTLGPGTSVQNLGPSARTFVLAAGSASDQVELWGSLDGVTFSPVERELPDGQSPRILFAGPHDNVTIDEDRSLFYAARRAAGSGAATLLVTGEDVGPQLSAASGAFKARNVGPAANVANLAAFTVAGNDGITDVAGDVVLLYAQTNPTENGPWVVGGVSAGAAPLTRPSWWPAGGLVPAGTHVDVAQGNMFNGTEWKAFATAAFVVDAANPVLVPLVVSQQVVLVNGTVTITNIPIRNAFVGFTINRVIANTTALTEQYNPRAITPGAIGVASAVVEAQIAAGTINAADLSTLNVTVTQG